MCNEEHGPWLVSDTKDCSLSKNQIHFYEDKPISVIAKEMGIPEETVKWHLNKARNELKTGFSMGKKLENWDYRR